MPNYYTSFQAVRENITNCDAPYEPRLIQDDRRSLKSAALHFIHTRCVGMRFDPIKEEEYTTKHYTGRSLRENQIPFNMERDIDRLCLERALGDFLDTGNREDAYTVYYCFLNMFLDGYSNSKGMFESLSEYEQNASTLLTKHRDHYSHSVYVFALGLAIYDTNKAYRNAFSALYRQSGADDAEREQKTAHFFLEYWGFCALFHDIGYPFELSYELAMVYYDREGKTRGDELYPVYRNVEALACLRDGEPDHIARLFGRSFLRLEGALAADIAVKLNAQYSLDEAALTKLLIQRPENPDQCGHHMDHAYFSAVRLYRHLVERLGIGKIQREHFDVLSAIVLHNSLFKFNIRGNNPPLKMETHPLAYLLMLCDELQCWDRAAYGRRSRKTQYPTDAEFTFSDGSIKVRYLFAPELKEIIKTCQKIYLKTGVIQNNLGLEQYNAMQNPANTFLKEIEAIVEPSIKIQVATDYSKPQKDTKRQYMSRKSFLNLYDLAVKLHALHAVNRKEKPLLPQEWEGKFLSQSLEYQLSGINRAKAFAGFLDAIDCFYSDRLLNHEEVKSFTDDEKKTIAPLEHGRWMRERLNMDWHVAEKKIRDKAVREQLRCHHLLLEGQPTDEDIENHFDSLTDADKEKDRILFPTLSRILNSEGVRIYHK